MNASGVKVPIVGRKIRFALVGCGRISQNHIASITDNHKEHAELVAVCDNNPQALEAAVAKHPSVKGYPALAELLGEAKPDVIVLTTPSGLHSSQAIESAQAGSHVVSEKPMATRFEDGLAMVKACENAGVQLFVVKQNRRNATLQRLKKAVDQGRFGRIYMVNINVFWQRPQDYYDQGGGWRGTWELDGGAFMNQASHYVDLVSWLMGPVKRINAFTSTLARKIQAEDTGVVNVEWMSGALGSINVTMLTYPKNFEGSITILGEKGTVRIGGVAVNEIQQWQFSDKQPDDETIQEASYQTTSVYGFGHPLYYENVIKTLRGETTPEVDGYQGLQSLEVLTAIYESAKLGSVVNLPLSRNP